MLIESGKYYKTRSGSIAFVGAAHCPFVSVGNAMAVIGWIRLDDGEVEQMFWNSLGYFRPDGESSSFDLIEETEAPQ